MTRNREKKDISSAELASKLSQQPPKRSRLKKADYHHYRPHSQRNTTKLQTHSHPSQKINPSSNEPDPRQAQTSGNRSVWLSWQLWGLLLVIVFGGVGFTATSLLLKLPKTPNCSKVYWPLASASMRLYCAQLEAEQKTVPSLLKAIDLVEELPQEHPLRPEINRNVEEWASDILKLGEQHFQAGKLEDAIAIAKKIPVKSQAYSLVEAKIKTWRSIWSKADEIYKDADKQLRQFKWQEAFRAAVRLTYVSNQYWATTKYEEVINKIQVAREESRKLDAAYVAFRRGGMDNLFKAIEKASEIKEESYAYKEAQDLIDDAKNKLLKQA
ncbi:MAG: LMBR1 domain-containing protein, partial [Moorea sp. SIO2B7]|nr:LMBR1 domain-containing protein [Moorena sp. SIO2B7]